MNLKPWVLCAAASATLAFASQARAADLIPYPNSGSYNATTYVFKAASTGDLYGYFAGSGASYDNMVGVLDNGVLTSGGYGLDDHSSSVGQSFDFGPVKAGDTLTFVLENLSLGANAYSNPALNVAYDSVGDSIGHNHVYSTPYTATSPIFAGVPTGIYVGFEDLPFPGSDFNYFDESFVFADTIITSGVPEPSTWGLMVLGIAGLGGFLRYGRKANVLTTS